MIITREMLIKKLAEKSNFYQRDIRVLLHYLDEVVFETFNEVDEGNDVSIQIVEGVKLKVTLVPPRERVDPRTQKPIIVKATVKPGVKYSENFREKIQNQYEEKKNG